MWTWLVSNVRTRLLGVPSRVAPLVAAESQATVCQQHVDEAIREALEALADQGAALEAESAAREEVGPPEAA